MKRIDKYTFGAVILTAGVFSTVRQAQAAAFGAGDLVVEQVGGSANYGAGASVLTNGGTAVFVDEFAATTTQTTPVQQIAIPTANNGSQLGVVESGTATSDGFLNLSADGRYLTFTGYNGALGGSTSAVGVAGVARVVGRIDGTGAVDTSTSSTTANSGNNFRSAVSTDGTTIYTTGAGSSTVPPVNLFTFGASSSTGITTTTAAGAAVTNTRNSEIFTTAVSVQSLYYSTGSGVTGVYMYNGLPTSTSATSTLLVADAGKSPSPYGFSVSPDGKTVYIADDATVANGGGIQKYTSPSGAAGTFTLVSTFATASRGLTVNYTGANPILYATTATGTTLYSITDDGVAADFSSQTAATLATAPANTAFRGVDFTPTVTVVPEPATVLAGALSLLAFVWSQRRRLLAGLNGFGLRGA